MATKEPATSSRPLGLSRWEFNALLLESVLSGAGLFALLSWVGRRFLTPVHPWAVAAAYGVGFLLLMSPCIRSSTSISAAPTGTV